MESLGDILKRIAANASLQTVNRDGARSPEDEAPQCAVCGGLGWLRRRVPLSHPDFGQLFPCDCLKERNRGELRSRLQRYSNLGHLADITFQSLRQCAVVEPGRRRLWERGLQASEDYSSAPDGWLVLSGPGGSGKTVPSGGRGQRQAAKRAARLLHHRARPAGPPAQCLRSR